MANGTSGIVHQYRHVWLLSALLLLIVGVPLLSGPVGSRLVGGITLTVLVAAAAVSARENKWQRTLAIVLAVPALLIGWSTHVLDGVSVGITSDTAYFLLFVFALASLLNQLVRVDISDFNIICGAVACYLLIATTWAISYRIVESFVPGSFSFTTEGNDIIFSDYLYFSFTTMTTLGYGDILPVKPFARIWSNLEAVTGTLYIALLIARLVAVYRQR